MTKFPALQNKIGFLDVSQKPSALNQGFMAIYRQRSDLIKIQMQRRQYILEHRDNAVTRSFIHPGELIET